MSGGWLFLEDRGEWRLYDAGALQMTVRCERVDALAQTHRTTRRAVLAWIGSRPTSPFQGR